MRVGRMAYAWPLRLEKSRFLTALDRRSAVTGRNLAPINGYRSRECGGEEESRQGDRGTSDESRFLAAAVDADAAVVSPVLLRPPERAMSAEAAPRAAWVMGLLALVGFMP